MPRQPFQTELERLRHKFESLVHGGCAITAIVLHACMIVARIFREFPGPAFVGCCQSCMSRYEPRMVHIAEVSKTGNGVTATSFYLRRTFREDGKVRHETPGNLSDLPLVNDSVL